MDFFTFAAPFYNTILSAVHKRQGKELLKRLNPLQGKKVLDLGGGTGKFAAQMTSAGADVWLLDASPQMLKQASRVLPAERVILGDAVNLPFPHSSFDMITLVDALHHIRKQEDTLSQCYAALLPGGSLYLLEFHPKYLAIRALAALERIVGEPACFLTPKELTGMLTKTGFVQIETKKILAYEYITLAKKPLPQFHHIRNQEDTQRVL